MEEKIKLILDSYGTNRVKENYPIAEISQLRVGGPARLLFVAFTQRELIKMLETCKDLKVPYFLFGTGSKIMLSDNGFKGVVIKNRTKNIQVVSIKGKVSKLGIGVEEAMVEVDSGVTITSFIEFLKKQNLSFADFLQIPGSIGGNLFINRALQSKVKSIKVLDSDLIEEKIAVNELSLREHIILSVVFNIKSNV